MINFSYDYDIYLFSLQQKITSSIFLSNIIFSPLILFLFMFAGFLTTINPCFLSLVPLSISYINSSEDKKKYKNIFVFGLFTSFVIIILLSTIFSYNSFKYLVNIPFISFFILIVLSLNLLQVINFNYFLVKINFDNILLHNDFFYIKNYATGLIIGFSSIPCSSPVILLIHFLLSNYNNILLVIIYLISYFLGCIITLVLFFYLFVDYLQLNFFQSIWSLVTPLAGFCILTSSLFFFLEAVFL
uniref:Thiol:disulfide interchange protein n=1 Tax=Taenioma perpusillum TaxID=210852 RepID=A0A1Z1MQT1_9FLOR|nr:thiol:disulfide interchange protein [Taenioma perpusillum]ARW68430.1 thiol:disulfide interchange protein [Taenioma perpusillum]